MMDKALFLLLLLLLLLQWPPPSHGLAELPASLETARSRGMLRTFCSPLAAPQSATPAVAVADCEVYLLGTVHLGSDSAYEAEELIGAVKPDVVVLEMMPSRLNALPSPPAATAAVALPAKVSTKVEPWSLLSPLVSRGWAAGGMGGAITCLVLWWEVLERSRTRDEEDAELPRRDEFVAAAAAAAAVATTTDSPPPLPPTPVVVAADWELDELIRRVATAMTGVDWARLALASPS